MPPSGGNDGAGEGSGVGRGAAALAAAGQDLGAESGSRKRKVALMSRDTGSLVGSGEHLKVACDDSQRILNEIEDLRAQLDEDVKKLGYCEANQKLRVELALKAKEVQCLRKQNEEMHAKYEGMRKLNEELQDKNDDFAKQNEELHDNNDGLVKQNKVLQTSTDGMKMVNGEPQDKNDGLVKQNAELQTVSDGMRKGNREMQAKNDSLMKRNEELQAEINGLVKQNAELQTVSDDMRKGNRELQAKNDSLMKRNEELQAKIDGLTKQNEAKNDDLRKQNEMLQAKNVDLTKCIEELGAKNDGQRKRSEELQAKNDCLTKWNEDMQAKYGKLMKWNEQLQAKIDGCKLILFSGGSSSDHSPAPTPSPTAMDYEQEEQFGEQTEEPQAEDMEMDDDDAPFLDLRDDRERQAYAILKHRNFGHTKAFNPDLLEKTGMDVDFARIWHAVGWDGFVPVEENGSRLLTIQFLCTLREVDDGVCFRLFGNEYYFTWRNLSHHLGFSECLPISLEQTCHGFSRHDFWGLISGQVVHGKFAPRCNDIQNPTLRLMHKWLAVTLFPRDDVRPVRNDELMILYAMVNKIRVSPVKAMVKQWLRNFKIKGTIECTSLITRIASSIGLLDGNAISFIEDPRFLIDESYLVQGHTLKKGPNDSLIFFSLGFANEIQLPNAGFHLYNCQSLTTPLIPQEEARRHNVSGLPDRMTSRVRREAAQPPQPQPSYHHEAGGSPWQSASTDKCAQQAHGRRSTS